MVERNLSKIATGILVSFVALLLVGCGLAPPHSICQWDAEQYIKRELMVYPASFDEHLMDTSRAGTDLGKVTENKSGWVVKSVILFGAQNSFGVKEDWGFRYRAEVDKDDNCGPIRQLELKSYQR